MVRRLVFAVITVLVAAACATEAEEPVTITLMTHDSFADAVTDDTFAAFTLSTGHAVEVLAAGDAGAMVNQAILTADNPLADAIFGVDDTFLTRAVEAGILESHISGLLGEVPEALRPDSDLATPIDYGDVCLNYDKEAFRESVPPATLEDLIDPAYAGQLVVEDPSISSPGLAFLLATIDRFGEDGWEQFWRDLQANDVLVAPGWSEAYYGEFSGGAGEGDRPIVVSYASSPPAEVIFSETPLTEAPTAVITDGCYRQVEYAAVLAGSQHEAEAAALIDFMLSVEFQETIPLNWFVFPANRAAALPPEFVQHTTIPTDPARTDPATIEQNRERWLDQWAEIFG
jgi:thiamine transport system substrate-binding protein